MGRYTISFAGSELTNMEKGGEFAETPQVLTPFILQIEENQYHNHHYGNRNNCGPK